MPAVRVMNWNIEQLSDNKVHNVPGVADAIARTVVYQNVDLLILLEVKLTNVTGVMNTLSNAMNGHAGGNDYLGWFLSEVTGGEYYGFIVRDLDQIRPLQLVQQPGRPTGTSQDPLNNLKKNAWTTWPSANWGTSAYPVAPPAHRPRIPLTDVFATSRGRGKRTFSGQPLGTTGYSLGRGYRLPCLALFQVHAAQTTTVPIVCCHYGATRGGSNPLARGQTSQMRLTHVAQLFRDSTAAKQSHYLTVNNHATRVQEILFTGDFNLDFLQNDSTANQGSIPFKIHEAYEALTPKDHGEGSAAPPPATPGPAAPVPPQPFNPPFADGPRFGNVDNQELRAAVTTQGTILKKYKPGTPYPTLASLRGAAFDNFFYGGTQLRNATINFGAGNIDSGEVVDVPSRIVKAGAAANLQDLDLSATCVHYMVQGTKNAVAAPNLTNAPGFGPPLTPRQRLIGARFVSDHLPVVIEFNSP